MMAMIEKILFYLQYPFVRYALIVGVLIALSSSLLGVTLVLTRYSYIGDGSHPAGHDTLRGASAPHGPEQ